MSLLDKQINNLALKSMNLKGVDILPQAIGELNIYESIVSPGILGNVTIADWQGFDEIGEIFADDDLIITFNTKDRDELSLKYKIYAADTSVEVSHTFQPITYRFCSPWLIDGLTRQISKPYKDKYIHEIIKDLLEECGADIGFIEPTIQKLNRFTTPLWTAVHSIHHLLSFAMNKQEVGGYVFWTDMKTGKTNVTTVDYLYKGTYGKEDQKFMSLPTNEFYEARIFDLSFDTQFDIIKYLNQGTAMNVYHAYYIDKNKTFIFDKRIDEVAHTHLSKALPLNKKFANRKYSSTHSTFLYPQNDALVTDENEIKYMVDGRAKTKYVRLSADMFKLNILTNANSSRRVGNLAEIEYQSTDKTKAEKNKQYSGNYLIRNIRHMSFNGSYRQAVTLISDGYKETNLSTLVNW